MKGPWLQTRNNFLVCNSVSLLHQFHDLVGFPCQLHNLVGVFMGGREGKEAIPMGSSVVWGKLGEDKECHGLDLYFVFIPSNQSLGSDMGNGGSRRYVSPYLVA